MATYKTYNGLVINSEDVLKEDMPNEMFMEIYEYCGVDVAISLLIQMRGNMIQVPTRGFIKYENKKILKDYDGTAASIRKIARNFGMSETYIRDVLKDNKINPPDENQIGLFDNAQ